MKKLLAIFLLLKTVFGFCQQAPKPYGTLPSKAQLNWHEMEMYCIIHFGANTYTDKEWVFGDENPAILNPKKFDAAQIVGAAKAGGFKGVVIVAKHHDGLCLWPTKITEHNISKTNFRNGKGDMLKEYQQACQQLGLYCSPLDRNSVFYGQPEHVEIYRNQLKELYSNYRKLFISWYDGANGGDSYYGGAKEVWKIDRSKYYGWPQTWAITRKMQPSAAIFGDAGMDVRWVGNEEGHAGETCRATYPPEAPDLSKTTNIQAFTYLPQQDKKLAGTVYQYSFYTSKNGTDCKEATSGEFPNIRSNPINQVLNLSHPVLAKYIRYQGKYSVNGNGVTAAEIGIIAKDIAK